MADTVVTIRSRIGCSPLVGRGHELAAIRAELAAAFRGEPRTVMLAGEAGIGKSRLLAEAKAFAEAAGGVALLGRCFDERGMPPYLPWINAVARHDMELPAPSHQDTNDQPVFSAADAVDRGPSATKVALRDLWAILAVGDSEGSPHPSITSPEQRRLHLFQSVTLALGRLARTRPLLLAFDDLQWSDAASNALLRYLVIHGAPAPLLVLAAYRTEEASANPELRRTIDELRHRRLAITVPVGDDEVHAGGNKR